MHIESQSIADSVTYWLVLNGERVSSHATYAAAESALVDARDAAMARDEPTTILGLLDAKKVVSIVPAGDKWRVREECDGYYSVELTREQLRNLANEILYLASQ
jgi:hypothetical protein